MNKSTTAIDLSWLRAQKPRTLSNRSIYLVPDGLVAEAIGSDEPAARLRHIWRWVCLNTKNLWISHPWDYVATLELERGSPIEFDQLINRKVTEQLRHVVLKESWDDWEGPVAAGRMSDKFQNYERKRNFFVEVGKFLASTGPGHADIKRDDSTGSDGVSDALRMHVQSPELPWLFATAMLRDYVSQEWESRIAAFPDRYAVGRIARIICCRFYMASVGLTKDLHNSWDDLQYAFLATYTQHFYCKDQRLNQIVEIVSPETAFQSD